MQCKYCGQLLEENTKFCSNCGKPCENGAPVTGQSVFHDGVSGGQPMASTNNQPSNNKKMILLIVGIVLIAVIAIVVLLLINGKETKESNSDSNSSSNVESNSNLNDSSTKLTVCSIAEEGENGSMTGTYKVTSKGGVVEVIESEEKIKVDDDYKMSLAKESLEEDYSVYADLEHYDYEIRIVGDTLVSNVSINYAKLDMAEFLQRNPLMSIYIKDGKLYLDDLLGFYSLLGVTCEK